MTLIERLRASAEDGIDPDTCYAAADLIEGLRAENARLPARRAQPTVKTAPIAPTRWEAWGIVGMIDETDEQFAERAGRKVAEVTE